MLLPLLLALAAPVPPAAAVSPTAWSPPARAVESFEELAAAFEVAVDEWRDALRSADRAERRALRDARPAAAFWDRFAALAGEDGRALAWMLDHADDAFETRRESEHARLGLYERAVEESVDAAWLPDVLERLATDRGVERRAGTEKVRAMFVRVEEGSERRENRTAATYRLGLMLLGSREPADQARGLERLKLVAALDGEDERAEAAAELVYDFENLRVGRTAPELVSNTVDGEEVKLSDHRGKVVVLNFFGFW